MITLTSLSLFLSTIFYFFGAKILFLLKEYFNSNIYSRTSAKLPIEYYHKVIDDLFNQSINLFNFLNLKFILPFIIMVISYLVIRYFYSHKNYINYFLASTVLVTGLNFIMIFPFNFSTIDRDLFNNQPKTVQFISENDNRIFSFLPGFTEYQKLTIPYNPGPKESFIFQSEFLMPKLNALYNIKSVDGFDSMMPRKYSEIIALIGSDRAVIGDKLSEMEISLEDKIKLFQERQNLLDMLGVRYIISGYGLEDENLKKVFTTNVTKYEIPVYIYENKDFLPLAYFANETEYLNPDSEINEEIIINNKNDFNRSTFIECSDCNDLKIGDRNIKVVESKNGYLKLKADISSESWLIFNEQNVPGWEVTIDGHNDNIYTANYLFQSVLVPAGEHEIIFNFSYWNIIDKSR